VRVSVQLVFEELRGRRPTAVDGSGATH